MPNHYETLGISQKDADDPETLKKAYKQRALALHPDKNKAAGKDTTQEFQQLSEAYTTINDPVKRADYDRKDREQLFDQIFKQASQREEYFKSTWIIPANATEFEKKYRTLFTESADAIKQTITQALNSPLQSEKYYGLWLYDKFKLDISAIESKTEHSKSLSLVIQELEKLFESTKERLAELSLKNVIFIQSHLKDFLTSQLPGKKLVFNNCWHYLSVFAFNESGDMDTSVIPKIVFESLTKDGKLAPYVSCKTEWNRYKFEFNPAFFSASIEKPVNDNPVFNNLLNYIDERVKLEKHTGSQLGFNRNQKLTAANLLIQFLSDNITAEELLKDKTLKAATQGKLRKIAQPVITRAKKELAEQKRKAEQERKKQAEKPKKTKTGKAVNFIAQMPEKDPAQIQQEYEGLQQVILAIKKDLLENPWDLKNGFGGQSVVMVNKHEKSKKPTRPKALTHTAKTILDVIVRYQKSIRSEVNVAKKLQEAHASLSEIKALAETGESRSKFYQFFSGQSETSRTRYTNLIKQIEDALENPLNGNTPELR